MHDHASRFKTLFGAYFLRVHSIDCMQCHGSIDAETVWAVRNIGLTFHNYFNVYVMYTYNADNQSTD